jgi:hypothetical protein
LIPHDSNMSRAAFIRFGMASFRFVCLLFDSDCDRIECLTRWW